MEIAWTFAGLVSFFIICLSLSGPTSVAVPANDDDNPSPPYQDDFMFNDKNHFGEEEER